MKNLLKSKKLVTLIVIALLVAIIFPLAVYASALPQVGPTGYGRPTSVGGALASAAQSNYVPTVWTVSGANLKVSGSTTIYPIVHAAVTSSAFTTEYPSIVADVKQLASGQGRDDMGLGLCDLAMSSSAFPTTGQLGTRDVNSDGIYTAADEGSANNMFDVTKIARDAVIVLLNTSVTGVTYLSKLQLQGIYDNRYNGYWDSPAASITVNGVTTTYPALGGNHIAIKPFARVVGSGTRQSFLDQISAHKISVASGDSFDLEETYIAAHGVRVQENADMRDAVNASDGSANGGIGYVGMGFDTLPDGTALTNVRVLLVDNNNATPAPVQPTTTNIYNRTYPLARSLQVGTLHGYTTPGSANAQSLINFLLSEDGQKCVLDSGFLKLYMDQDVNQSLSITVSDVAIVGSHWGEHGAPHWIRADVNGSGTITVSDVASIGSWWGFTYAAP